LVKYAKGVGKMEIRDVPEPSPEKGQVKIGVKATGICGSDLHIYHDDIAISLNPPVVTGHEFSGVVCEIGSDVDKWREGDRVVPELGFVVCGRCDSCISGFPNLCDYRKSVGYWYNGAFTSYTVVPATALHKLPDNISFQEGALMEPLACAVHAVLELSQITAGDVVLLTGPGSIGLCALQLAKAQGANVVVAGRSKDMNRLDLARRLGADRIVDIDQESLLDVVFEITKQRGADVVLECSGNETAVNDALQVIKKRGQLTQIGLFGKPITIDYEKICYKEIRLTGSLGQRSVSWEKAIQLVSQQKILVGPLISHVLPISEWERAFAIFEENKGVKILLTPS
jgi:L-iditol 2-dehydrogenase